MLFVGAPSLYERERVKALLRRLNTEERIPVQGSYKKVTENRVLGHVIVQTY